MSEYVAPEAASAYTTLVSEPSAAFLRRIDPAAARGITTFVRALIEAEPVQKLVAPQYSGDAPRYIEEAQSIAQRTEAMPAASWHRYICNTTTEQGERLATLERTWRASEPAYKQWSMSLEQQQVTNTITGSVTPVKRFFRGTQVMVAGAAKTEARARYATDCEAVGRIMLSRMAGVADTVSVRAARNNRFRALLQEAKTEAAQLPYEATLPNFWNMDPDTQREITAEIGRECISLWHILGAHGSAHQLRGLYNPRIVRPVADLAHTLPRVEGKAQKVALTTAFVSECASFEPEKDKNGKYLPIEPPQRSAFDAFLEQVRLQPEVPDSVIGDVADFEINQTYLLSDEGQRLTVSEARNILDKLIDNTADEIYSPHQSQGAQRRLSWDIDRVDFGALLCGNRPIGVYDLRLTPLEVSPTDVSSRFTVAADDIRLYRLEANLKSTGRPAVNNSLHVVVWALPGKGFVQMRKKALDKKQAAEVVVRERAKSAQTAVPRKFVLHGAPPLPDRGRSV